jgi:hypothetical protein
MTRIFSRLIKLLGSIINLVLSCNFYRKFLQDIFNEECIHLMGMFALIEGYVKKCVMEYSQVQWRAFTSLKLRRQERRPYLINFDHDNNINVIMNDKLIPFDRIKKWRIIIVYSQWDVVFFSLCTSTSLVDLDYFFKTLRVHFDSLSYVFDKAAE